MYLIEQKQNKKNKKGMTYNMMFHVILNIEFYLFLSDVHQDKCCSVSIDMGKICVFLRNIWIPISIYQIPHERRQGQFETHSVDIILFLVSLTSQALFSFSNRIRINIFTYIWYDIQGRRDITSFYPRLLKSDT